jgi:hypothetical protein
MVDTAVFLPVSGGSAPRPRLRPARFAGRAGKPRVPRERPRHGATLMIQCGPPLTFAHATHEMIKIVCPERRKRDISAGLARGTAGRGARNRTLVHARSHEMVRYFRSALVSEVRRECIWCAVRLDLPPRGEYKIQS